MTRPPDDADDGPELAALSAGALDEADAEVLRRTAQLYETLDPMPAGLLDRIRFGITLDALHAEVAELQRNASLAGVRAEAPAETSETITFTSASTTTMITLTALSADRVRVDGWVVPGEQVTVELRRPDGSSTTTTDDDGRFVFAEVPRGLAQFVLRGPDPAAPHVITPSIEL